MSETSSEPTPVHPATTPAAARWTGRVLSILLGLLLIFSAIGKLFGGPSLEEAFAHLGLPLEMRVPLGILELVVAIIYLVPNTAILGAILLTGYMGGAICTHLRVGDAFYVQVIIGVLIWLGVFLRDRRLWSLIPLRT